MIKIQYKDELGIIEASFNTLEEYNSFKDKLIADAKARAEREKAVRIAKELADEERMRKRWDELKLAANALAAKAKSYGVMPTGLLEIIKAAIYDQADDRCLPGPSVDYACKGRPADEVCPCD